MGKYMDNPSLDVMITAIVNKEMEEYKSKILNAIDNHFNNPYCAATDIGKVMYEKEIKDLINRIEIWVYLRMERRILWNDYMEYII